MRCAVQSALEMNKLAWLRNAKLYVENTEPLRSATVKANKVAHSNPTWAFLRSEPAIITCQRLPSLMAGALNSSVVLTYLRRSGGRFSGSSELFSRKSELSELHRLSGPCVSYSDIRMARNAASAIGSTILVNTGSNLSLSLGHRRTIVTRQSA